MKPAVAVVAALVAVAFASTSAEAKRRRDAKACKKEERFVEDGTPVLGGPGLGFEVTAVVGNARCARVLQATDDGSFVLILVESDQVGWVATGLVDAALSETGDLVQPVPLEPGAATKASTLLAVALRTEPRFDAPAARALKENEPVDVLGRSPDAQWLFVAAGKDKGWVPKFQTTTTPVAAGAATTAGTGAWAPQKAAFAPGATPPPVDDDAARAAAKKQAAEAAKLAQLPAVTAPPAPEPPLLGRRASLTGAVRGTYWTQQYASDAQDDPFARYVVQSGGGGAAVAYAHRFPDFGLVVDAGARFDGLGFSFALPAGGQAYVPAAIVGLEALGGWRLYGARDVDVEAALGYAMDLYFVGDLAAAGVVVPAFATGVHHAAKPKLIAKARLDEGRFGMFVVEGALPIGGYHLLPDPGERYRQQPSTPEPDVFVPRDPRPGVPVPADDAIGTQPTTYLHLGVGAEGRVAYVVGLADALLLDVGLFASARQALIGGPGRRVGAYANASSIDMTAGVQLGVGWAF